jgi:hypothetical protein
MFVSKWQLVAMLASLGETATVADLEAHAENLFHEPVTIVVYDDAEPA